MNAHAETFRRLHAGPEVLALVNCWDAGSARLLESLGAPAIATTSAGLAWANGHPDGDALPVDLLISAVRAITRVIHVPLSVDVEGGYSDVPAVVGETIARVVDAGAVGINLEDGGGTPALLASKIEQVKTAARRAGVDLFVNARTDVYLRGLVPEEARSKETLARARIYRDAGADGLFVPKVVDAASIRAIAAECGLPLNVLAGPSVPPATELRALGVRRVSTGSALASIAYGRAATAAETFLREGRSEPLTDGAIPYAKINALFARDAGRASRS
jgi:2-methylisocitrate lyase-like PEP mutase family enzyme